MVRFELLHPKATLEHLGYIPHFLDEKDPDNAVDQLNKNYAHGGGWHEFKGFAFDPLTGDMKYLDDPTYHPIAKCKFRKEVVYMYPHAWITVVEEDGTVRTARMD